MSALYNSISRKIDARLEFYFTSEPVVITNSDYLISFNLLEELGSDAEANPIGAVSANGLDIVLYNENGIFSPANPQSPYYGLMRSGVRVIVKLRPAVGAEWDELGTFYVNDWYAEVTGLQASLTCYDKLYDALNSPAPALPVTKETTYYDAFDAYLKALGYKHTLDTDLRGTMSWWYTLPEAAETLRNLADACRAAVFCDHHDNIRVLNLAATRAVAATLTDDNQIIKATVPQSINRNYAGLDVSIYNTQLSDQIQVLDMKEHSVPVGTTESNLSQFSKRPVARLECVTLTTPNTLVELSGYKYTSDAISLKTRNMNADNVTAAVAAYGKIAEAVKTTYYTYGNNPLVYDNVYTQTADMAGRTSRMLEKFIKSALPTLALSIRGNPQLNLGDKITVSSERYNLLFTGILQRASYTYNGALRCDINLVDSNILEVS